MKRSSLISKNGKISVPRRKEFGGMKERYSVFHRFRHAEFANGGSILSSSQDRYCPSYLKK
jgi:hypothetical protein